MKALSYLNLVNTNAFALKALKMLMCLPLLPATKIEEGFILIKSFAIHHSVPMVNLFNYYQRYVLSLYIIVLTKKKKNND